MLDRLKNPDLAALLTLLAVGIAELATQLASDASLLAILPDWLVPLALAVAAAARYRLTGRPAGEAGQPSGVAIPDRPTQPD